MRKSARVRLLVFTLIGAGCFEDSGKSGAHDCTPGTRACACVDGTCGVGLACRSEVCVEPDCIPGTAYCNCDGAQSCAAGLECDDGKVCLPPDGETGSGTSTSGAVEGSGSGSGSGSTATGADGSGTADGSGEGEAGTTGGGGDETGGEGTSDPGGETGESSSGSSGGRKCTADADCLGLLLYCDFEDDACGTGTAQGLCRLRPDLLCPPGAPVLGCDCQPYPNACEAHRAGTDAHACGDMGDPCPC